MTSKKDLEERVERLELQLRVIDEMQEAQYEDVEHLFEVVDPWGNRPGSAGYAHRYGTGFTADELAEMLELPPIRRWWQVFSL
jgi:hypothetical protein